MKLSQPLVTVRDLAGLLNREDVVIADCRFNLSDRDAGRPAYEQAHIPGAVYFHLDDDLAAPVGAHGGRHPIPDPAVFAAKLGAAGIGPGVSVVVYDDPGAAAARFWWLLRYFGHDAVSLLDGGFKAWVAAGQPVTSSLPHPTPKRFVPTPHPEMTADMTEVRDRPADITVIDARSAERFAGQPNPLDPWPGHVPGAINRPWGEGLNPDGFWKSPAQQRARFAGLDPVKVIHQCGSGVTACANMVAMEIAGLRGYRLYPGSWSDWCTWAGNPVEKG